MKVVLISLLRQFAFEEVPGFTVTPLVRLTARPDPPMRLRIRKLDHWRIIKFYLQSQFILWLNPRAGKVKRILCFNWQLPERTRRAHLYRQEFSALVPQENVFCGYLLNPLLAKLVRSRIAGYWPRSVFFLCFYWPWLPSRSIKEHKRTWPILTWNTWSIGHICYTVAYEQAFRGTLRPKPRFENIFSGSLIFRKLVDS